MKYKNLWLTSDTHFDHKKLTEEYEPSRIKTSKKEGYNSFDEFLVDNWNDTVKENDWVLHLGDFTIDSRQPGKTKERINTFAPHLNGKIALIFGNHDRIEHIPLYEKHGIIIVKKKQLQSFDIKNDYRYIDPIYYGMKYNGLKLMFSHFPYFQNDKLIKIFENGKFDYNIHGHTHSKLTGNKKCLNVCLERTNFKPIKLKDILKKST